MIKDDDDPEVQRLNSNQQVSYQPHYECCCSPWCAAGAWKEAWRRGNTASANSAPMQTQPTPAQVETLSLHMALTRLCYSFPHFRDSAMATVCSVLEKPMLESCPNCRTGWLSLFLLCLSSFFVSFLCVAHSVDVSVGPGSDARPVPGAIAGCSSAIQWTGTTAATWWLRWLHWSRPLHLRGDRPRGSIERFVVRRVLESATRAGLRI